MAETKAVVEKDLTALTQKQFDVLMAMRELSGDYTYVEVAEKLGKADTNGHKAGVNLIINGLIKRDLAVRSEGVEVEVTDAEGKAVKKTVKFVSLTDLGANGIFHVA